MAAQPSDPLSRDWWWIFDPRESLRARAALIFGGGAVVFTLLVAWIGSSLLRRQLETQLGTTFESLAVQMSNTIDRRLYERYRELLFVAELAPLRDGRASPADRRRVLESLQAAAPDFAWIGFADASGHIVAATKGVLEGQSVSDRPWFVGAQEHPYAASLHEMPATVTRLPDREADPRVFDFAVPVTGVNGELAGVIGAHLRWTWAREIQSTLVPEAARRERIGITVYSAAKDVLLDSGASGWSEPPDPPVLPPRRFRGSMVENTAEGSTYLTGYMLSRGHAEFRGVGWLTTVRQPVARAFAPAQDLQRAIARWGFLFSALFLFVSWVAADRFARRLDAVAAAATRIRSGDILTVMPPARGQIEIDRMCGAVGELVEELRPKDSPAPAPSPLASRPGGARPEGSDPRRVIW